MSNRDNRVSVLGQEGNHMLHIDPPEAETEGKWNYRLVKTGAMLLMVAVGSSLLIHVVAKRALEDHDQRPRVLRSGSVRHWYSRLDPGVHLGVTDTEAWLYVGDQAWKVVEKADGSMWLWCGSYGADTWRVRVVHDQAKPNCIGVSINGESSKKRYTLWPMR